MQMRFSSELVFIPERNPKTGKGILSNNKWQILKFLKQMVTIALVLNAHVSMECRHVAMEIVPFT